MSSDSFYSDLPRINSFTEIANPDIYTELPDDWWIAVSDIKDSTMAIRRGEYKEVNLIGASTIIAILNIKKSFSLPFIFGGDGAAICIPESLLEETRKALLGTKKMALEIYGLELRVGIIPLRFIREKKLNVCVARCRLSDTVDQAAFTGGGLQFAEECIKSGDDGAQYKLQQGDAEPLADFTGLECRWNNVPSQHGEINTLIIQAITQSEKMNNAIYREVIEQIELIYGNDAACHPVREKDLSMALKGKTLSGESMIRSFSKGKLFRIYYWFKIRYGVLLGKYLMMNNIKTKLTDWGKYKSQFVENTDYKKFDDKLRQVLSGTTAQRMRLDRYLEERYNKKELVYGIHVASSALVTCLIFNYHAAHVHLVDSNNGGYTVAAMQLKERLKKI